MPAMGLCGPAAVCLRDWELMFVNTSGRQISRRIGEILSQSGEQRAWGRLDGGRGHALILGPSQLVDVISPKLTANPTGRHNKM